MFIPIITVFSDVIRLITFQPLPAEGNSWQHHPCPEPETEPALGTSPAALPARQGPRQETATAIAPLFSGGEKHQRVGECA